MLIKLAPPPSQSPAQAPTPTILFALAFPDLPQSLPLPPGWAAQLARLAADDLEAPPALHALDRAAGLPSLLGEVLFDLNAPTEDEGEGRVVCTFLDGKVEEWAMTRACAEMLRKVIADVEESGRAEQRMRERVEEGRARAEREEAERAREAELQRERDHEAEMAREYEAKMQSLKTAKGKGKEQSLNSPPASLNKRAPPKGRLHRSRSLLMALVATFSNSNSSSSPSNPEASTSAPTSRASYSGAARSTSPLRKFARRASFSALSSKARADSGIPEPPASQDETLVIERPVSPAHSIPTHNLETPPSSAPPSAPSSTFSRQQSESSRALGMFSVSSVRREELSPRLLRRRARSTLVDAFRAHVIPPLGPRVGLFEPGTASLLHFPEDEGYDSEGATSLRGAGGGYHAWVARSMLRRAEARMHELESEWPTLASTSRYSNSASADSASPLSVTYPQFSPNSISFPASPTSPTIPQHATFEPWSSDEESESESEDDPPSECELVGNDSDSDGSSVHTPESGHSIGVSYVPSHDHALETSTSTTSSYFTCADGADADEDDVLPAMTASHIRRPAQTHSRVASSASGPPQQTRRRASSSSAARARKEQRELKRAQRAARTEHVAFARMTVRLRGVLAQAGAARTLLGMQKDEADRVREGRGLRRAWLDRRTGGKPAEMVQVFRPSGLGRGVFGADDVVEVVEIEGEGNVPDDKPPAYEDVIAQEQVQAPMMRPVRSRPNPPIPRTRTLVHLENLEVDVELEHFELDAVELDGLDIEVDLERLDLSDALEVDEMGLDVDVDGDMAFGPDVEVFGGKACGKARRGPGGVPGRPRLEGWERRRTIAI